MRHSLLRSATLAAALVWSCAAIGQDFQCTPSRATNPDRIVFNCPGGVVLEAEAAAAVGMTSGGLDVAVDNGAALATVSDGSEFQIRMPHAIASVRGTTFAVNVSPTTSSVFVVDGTVEVRRVVGAESVTLEPGEGVDVTDDARMTVNTWSQERAAALLGRFGR